jgi:cephalosporin-C deacetylase-like acetyl esterase
VNAFVVEPPGNSDAGVVIAHGGSEPGKHFYVEEALALAANGVRALAADTSFPAFRDLEADERAIRRAILTQRRGLDVLAELGATQLGFYGHSAGATQGAVLSGVEPRLDAVVLSATGAGIVRWAREFAGLDNAYLEALDRLDPRHFVARAGRRRLLVQHGHRDPVIPADAARAMYEAAAEPKQWQEYDCDHGVDVHPQARADRIAFFRDAFGLD